VQGGEDLSQVPATNTGLLRIKKTLSRKMTIEINKSPPKNCKFILEAETANQSAN